MTRDFILERIEKLNAQISCEIDMYHIEERECTIRRNAIQMMQRHRDFYENVFQKGEWDKLP